MRSYFARMQSFGKALREGQVKSSEENLVRIKQVEKEVAEALEKVKNAGFPTEKINARGQLTVFQRLDYLVDEGT